MRFHLGPPPPNTEFNPANGPWVKLKEPNPWLLVLCQVPATATVRNQGYYTWWQPTTLPRAI